MSRLTVRHFLSMWREERAARLSRERDDLCAYIQEAGYKDMLIEYLSAALYMDMYRTEQEEWSETVRQWQERMRRCARLIA